MAKASILESIINPAAAKARKKKQKMGDKLHFIDNCFCLD
jgi:hypothetical protein